MPDYSVVSFAYEILTMQNRLNEQEQELEYLRNIKKKYDALLTESIIHSEHMMTALVNAALGETIFQPKKNLNT